jgi:predicted ABC-type ATPase
VLAGHNGSGKSTLWHQRLVSTLEMPLINADRLTASILPDPDERHRLPAWAQRLRDEDARRQELSQQGVRALGHAVPVDKLIERFPRTQAAVGHAAPLADMTLFFDNSRSTSDAFALVRVQQRKRVSFDCRDEAYLIEDDLLRVAQAWLPFVVGAFPQR